MQTFKPQTDKVYFSFKNIRYLSVLLFLSISMGIIMNALMGYRAFGFGIVVYRDLVYIFIVLLMAAFYYGNKMKLTTVLLIISYTILTGYGLILPFLLKENHFIFISYFLEIQFLTMLFGLILTIGVRPYHDLILGAINFILSTLCVIFIDNFQIETYLFFTIIVTAKCIICYMIFQQVFKLRRKMKTHHETIIKQNLELLELTNFRKDIIRIIAHDLRSPISQISSLLEAYKLSDTEDERNEIMDYFNVSVNNAKEMLENLLDWAMQNNEALKEYSMFNIYDVISSIEVQLKAQISSKKLRIKNNVPRDLEVYYSKNVIESVTRNLMVNAVKFSPTENDILIYFEDRDINFSIKIFNKTEEEQLENINQFNNGKKLNTTNGTANEIGSGNGLKVCREMLAKNNGELSLVSEDEGVLATVLVTKTL